MPNAAAPAHCLDCGSTYLYEGPDDPPPWCCCMDCGSRNISACVDDLLREHAYGDEVASWRSDLSAALDCIRRDIRTAEQALARLVKLYDADICEGEPAQVLPAALSQMRVGLHAALACLPEE